MCLYILKKYVYFFLILSVFCSYSLFAQSVIEDLETPAVEESVPTSSLSTEVIIRISQSKRIFILTNKNNSFDKGDFITIVLNSKRVARAIAAKIEDDHSGIKIIKIYSLKLWNMLRVNMEVQIIRGDDSLFGQKVEEKEVKEEAPVIKEEADLFNETLLDEDILLDEKKKRHIKTDNIVALSYGLIEGLDNDGSDHRYGQPVASWAYQIADNIWAEASYGQNLIRDYPNSGLDTKLTNFTIKAMYTIKAPFYSFIQPFVGYQIIGADSPGAGQPDSTEQLTDAQIEQEISDVDDLKKNRVIFGINMLKRLVPGWFAKVNLGLDIYSIGLALEF